MARAEATKSSILFAIALTPSRPDLPLTEIHPPAIEAAPQTTSAGLYGFEAAHRVECESLLGLGYHRSSCG